jgi:hypothetical protein
MHNVQKHNSCIIYYRHKLLDVIENLSFVTFIPYRVSSALN